MNDPLFDSPVILENDRVRLEPLEPLHLSPLAAVIQYDPSIMKYASLRVEDEATLAAYLDDALGSKAIKFRYPFAVFDKLTNTYAGSTSFANISYPNRRLEIGYTWIGRQHQRTGLNRAMKYLMLQYAFETLGCYRVELKADSRNQQSRTAMQQIGATFEGELRSYTIKPDGYRANAVYYSILAEEWPQIKAERFAKQGNMKIVNSTMEDIEEIFRLYRIASNYMKERFFVSWPEFDRGMVEKEISENRQWKLVSGTDTVCIWATTFNDPQIWEERNADPAVYIHRIATNPDHRGQKQVSTIVDWARHYAANNNKHLIRMDTVGENEKLIAHYTGCGFNFLGLKTLQDTSSLPQHYKLGPVCLFELPL